MTTQVSNLSIFLSEYDYMGPNTMSNRIISGVLWVSIVVCLSMKYNCASTLVCYNEHTHVQYGWGIIQHLYLLHCEMVRSLLLRRQFVIPSAHSWQFIVRNMLLERDVTAKGRNVIIRKTVNMITQNYCHKQHHNSIMNSTDSGLSLYTFSLSVFSE